MMSMTEEGDQVSVETKMRMELYTQLPKDWFKNSLSAQTLKSLKKWLQKHFGPNQQNNMDYMSILLHVGGGELLAHVKSRTELLSASDSTKTNEVELLSLFSHVEESSLPLVFLLYERHKFFNKTQAEEEPVCEFVNDIKVMAKYCDFQENEDQIVASRIRSGLFKDCERQQLENESDSDLIKLPLCELLNLNSSGSQSYQCPVHTIRSKVPNYATDGLAMEEASSYYTGESTEIKKEIMTQDTEVEEDSALLYGDDDGVVKDDNEHNYREIASVGNITIRDLTKKKKRVKNKKKDFRYKCLISGCGQFFSKSKLLKSHVMESHMEMEMLKCEICSESHPNSASLARHRKSKHSDIFCSFQCDVCQVGFQFKRAMELHRLKAHTYHGENIIICKYCLKAFPDTESFKEHEKQSHSGDRKYPCDMCSKKFKAPYHVERHKMRKHNAPKPYICEVCGASFVLNTEIIEHRLIHTKNEKPFECLDCGQSFRIKSALSHHLLSHIDVRPFICELCGNSYKCKTALTAHIRGHRKKRTHVCDDCGAAFFDISHLETHKLNHTGERPFKCHICPKAFKTSNSLKVHIQVVHEGIKPVKRFSCNLCSYLSTCAADLKSHSLKHTGERPFACLYCDASYRTRTQLNVHMRKHTEEKFFCSVCGDSFFTTTSLRKHKLNKHEPKRYKCGVCGKAFATATILRRHEIYHQPKKYKCDKCTKAFSCPQTFEKHKRVHSGLKPNKCQVCCKAFNTHFSARRHLKLVHKIEDLSFITVTGD